MGAGMLSHECCLHLGFVSPGGAEQILAWIVLGHFGGFDDAMMTCLILWPLLFGLLVHMLKNVACFTEAITGWFLATGCPHQNQLVVDEHGLLGLHRYLKIPMQCSFLTLVFLC
ncbi:hypothetical protein Nepgr_007938 [Nepenthes gracilis]|uniref:Uncharacterized protein n=1 Tax=Nepenthes gracilis TaxID=150966 RepID=A0AAD3S7X7_NEPGR|nr:hypothetical protein Nepgr_007938 [Nepenthes gracilis]